MTLAVILSAIVVGLMIGALGRLVLPGRQDIPIWLTILIGIVAALIGSFIAYALGVGETRDRLDWTHHPGGPGRRRCGTGRWPVRPREKAPVRPTPEPTGPRTHLSGSAFQPRRSCGERAAAAA